MLVDGLSRSSTSDPREKAVTGISGVCAIRDLWATTDVANELAFFYALGAVSRNFRELR